MQNYLGCGDVCSNPSEMGMFVLTLLKLKRACFGYWLVLCISF